MPYKVFFVEDEIVTREGIRDNIDWRANGFEFCGEAADGEMALPLLQSIRPEVLITDIKMPFMDGLQLCKIVRERWPKVKIIILSGHDEFEYAQKAIELGVTEYLLKPVTAADMCQALKKIAALLEQEHKEQEVLEQLRTQVAENRATLRERFLLKLLLGAIAPSEAIEGGQAVGLDLVARYYLVVILKIELQDRTEQFDYDEYKQVQTEIAGLVENNPDVYLSKKDLEYLVLVLKGNTPEFLEEERDRLLEAIKQKAKTTRYKLIIGLGGYKCRIAELYQSFVEALATVQKSGDEKPLSLNEVSEKAELLRIEQLALDNYLRCGVRDGFDSFFAAHLQPLMPAALKSHTVKNYLFLEVIIATARLINQWGGEIDQVVPELDSVETILTRIRTAEQFKEQVARVMLNALTFRDLQAGGQHIKLIHQAQEYIKSHYMETNLSLNELAALVNLSSSHFSVVFAQETAQTFKDYLTEVRIQKAKELLRTTSLKSADISSQVGYSDPHYFSYAFKKKTGFSPVEFRLQARA